SIAGRSCARQSEKIFRPRNYCVDDRDFVDLAPFQFGEEVARIQGFSSQSFWKRGSPRKGSHCGWSLRSAGVRQLLYGICKRCCSLGIARFFSPIKTSTNAKFSSALGPSTASSPLGPNVLARSASFIAAFFCSRISCISERSR